MREWLRDGSSVPRVLRLAAVLGAAAADGPDEVVEDAVVLRLRALTGAEGRAAAGSRREAVRDLFTRTGGPVSVASPAGPAT